MEETLRRILGSYANNAVSPQATRALQAYLGHRNIQNTTRYTALAPDRFKGFWRD
jgi:site-specific recombinase XerD